MMHVYRLATSMRRLRTLKALEPVTLGVLPSLREIGSVRGLALLLGRLRAQRAAAGSAIGNCGAAGFSATRALFLACQDYRLRAAD
jgi:hypothetical protein